jgi:hypothetical protein
MTAYRQESLRCARMLEAGPLPVRDLRASGTAPNAARILQADVYGWFERVARGTYALTPAGRAAVEADADRA